MPSFFRSAALPARALPGLTLPALILSSAIPLTAVAQNADPSGTLAPVQVTATRYAETASVLPYGVSVITAEDIHSVGATSVSDAIRKLLGVPGSLDASGGTNYGLDLRGFGTTAMNNQVVVVDGMRLNDDDQSTPNLSGIPISAVQRIEVLRGSGAVQYGQGATGGVIVITTYAGRGVQRPNSVVLSAEAGSLGLVDERANAVLGAGGFSVDVAAQERRTSGNRSNFASDNSSLAATAQWSNDWLRLGVKGGNSALHSGLPGSLSGAQFLADQTQASTPNDWGTLATTNGAVFAEAALGDWVVNFDAAQRTKLSKTQSSSSDSYGTANNQSLRARNESQWGSVKNAVVVGLEQSQWVRYALPDNTESFANTNGWYVSDDLSFPSQTRLSLGVRNEDEKKTVAVPSSNAYASPSTPLVNNLTAWQLGVDQTLATHWNVYAHAGQSFRLANIDDMTYASSTIPLLPQISQDQELGVRWDSDGHHTELRWFHSDVANEIGLDPINYVNVNLANTVHQGVELESRHALNRQSDLRLNLATRSARFASGTYTGNNLTQVPQQTAAVGLDVRPAAGHLVNVSANWVSEQAVDFANTCTIPAYTTLDTRYAYTLRNLEFSVAVHNLTDARYYTLAYTCTGGVTGGIYPEAGRTVSAAIRVSF